MTSSINESTPLQELTAACDAYEIALMENTLQKLDTFFWESPMTLRYGVGENLYGIEAIREFRKARPDGSPKREVVRRQITVLSDSVGICNLEFRRLGGTVIGRQSQTWIKTDQGWRVAAAHVSLMGVTS